MLSHRLEVIKCNEENNNIQLGEQTYGLHKRCLLIYTNIMS